MLSELNRDSSHLQSLTQLQPEGSWGWSHVQAWLSWISRMLPHTPGSRCWLLVEGQLERPMTASAGGLCRWALRGSAPRVSVPGGPCRSWKPSYEWTSEIPITSATFYWSRKSLRPAHIQAEGNWTPSHDVWSRKHVQGGKEVMAAAAILETMLHNTILGNCSQGWCPLSRNMPEDCFYLFFYF